MKNNHTQLKRLAAISLVLMMCLSALPMLAPSASAAEDVTPLGSSGGGRGKVCITFDDVARSVYDYAYPVMSAAGITATVFVTTDWIGGETPLSHAPCMDVTELHVLQSNGWEIGSHSVSHRVFTGLTPEQITYEYAESKSILTDLGFEVDTFAYPYGSFTPDMVSEGREYYSRLRTIGVGMTTGHFMSEYPNSLPTTGAYGDVLSWDRVKSLIDQAIYTDTTVILLYHQLTADGTFKTGGSSPEYADYDIQTLVDYIVEMRELYGLQTINYRDLPDSAPDADIYVWDGEGESSLASDPANWYRLSADGTIANDVAPVSGANLVFNDTSSANCDYDLDIIPHSIYVDWTYSSSSLTVVSGYDLTVGAGGLHLMGTRPYVEQGTIITSGDLRMGTTLLENTKIIFDGCNSQILAVEGPMRIASMTVSGIAYYSGIFTTEQLSVDRAGELYLMPSRTLSVRSTTSGENMNIDGRIAGPGTLKLDVRATGAVYDISNVESPVLLEQWSEIASPSVTTLYGNSAAELRIVNQHATHQMIVKASESLSVTGLTLSSRTTLMGGDSVITTTTWDSTAGSWTPEESTVVLRDGGSARLAPGQSFNRLEIASDDGRSATWTMTATGAQAPIVTGLRSGNYLWYLDGVKQGEVEADKDGTIELSYQSTGLHTLEVKPTSMTAAMDGLASAIGIVAVLAVLGGLITMVGRLKF